MKPTITDINGGFSFSRLEPGEYQLVVEAVGHVNGATGSPTHRDAGMPR